MKQLVLALGVLVLSVAGINGQATFTNPVRDENSADPCVMRLDKFYYLTLSTNRETELRIYKSPKLSNFRDTPSTIAYNVTAGEFDLWASEMHLIDGQLYIYFTTQKQGDSQFHRMYVIQAEDPTDPMGKWSEPITLMPNYEFFAIDGTILRHGGELYFVFSSNLEIWIARMSSPTKVGDSFVRLRYPQAEWECRNSACVNEGPFFIYNRNVSYMIFSVGGTWTPDYALAMMSIEDAKDPLVPSNWWFGDDGPVFYRNDEEQVYTTGHACFTTSLDNTETWLIYHGSNRTEDIDQHRIARIDKITWDEESGKPVFGRPHGYAHPQPVPSGEAA